MNAGEFGGGDVSSRLMLLFRVVPTVVFVFGGLSTGILLPHLTGLDWMYYTSARFVLVVFLFYFWCDVDVGCALFTLPCLPVNLAACQPALLPSFLSASYLMLAFPLPRGRFDYVRHLASILSHHHHHQELTALRLRYDSGHKRLANAERELKQERGGPPTLIYHIRKSLCTRRLLIVRGSFQSFLCVVTLMRWS